MSDIIFENENYAVTVKTSIEDKNKENIVYALTNKKTKVREAEHTMLPHILTYAKQLDGAIEEFYNQPEEVDGNKKNSKQLDLVK